MAGDTVTLVLSGEIMLTDFTRAVSGLQRLVRSLSAEVSPGAKVRWIVDSLEAGSTIATIRGVASDGDGSAAIERIAQAYIEVGEALARHEPMSFSLKVQRQAHGLTAVLKRSVESIRFETADGDATITQEAVTAGRPAEVRALGERGAYGAVEGRVQTLSNRGGLRFTLYDSLDDHAVSCYLVEGHEDVMRDAWGRRAIVEGWVSHDPVTGRPQTIRRVQAVQVLPETKHGGYRDARGAVPVESQELRPEAAIRRLRDA